MDDISNRFAVGARGDEVVIVLPLPRSLMREDARNLAVWLAALAFDDPQRELPELLERVLNT